MAANLRRLGGANVRFQDRLMGQAMAEVGRERTSVWAASTCPGVTRGAVKAGPADARR